MSLMLGRKKKRKTVVFVCTGDTCRGPMAQGYMKKALEERGIDDVEVRTAGVMTIPGLIPTPEAVQVMKTASVDITPMRSSQLTKELIRKADLILGMTPFHVQWALRESDEAKGKTYLLKEFAESDVKNYQISDPMGATLEVYKRVYREMKLAIDRMLENKEFFTGKPPEDIKKEKTARSRTTPPKGAAKGKAPKVVAKAKGAGAKPAAGKANGSSQGAKKVPAAKKS